MLQPNDGFKKTAVSPPVGLDSSMERRIRRSVVLIESERDVIELLTYRLEKEFIDVLAAQNGGDGVSLSIEYQPDLIILDEGIGGVAGRDVCQLLRGHDRTSHIPIIMTSVKPDEVDRVLGLEAGADDYIVKPFYLNEFLARVRATFRRLERQEQKRAPIRHGDLMIDPLSHAVSVQGTRVALTASEYRILTFLSDRSPRVVSRDEIIDEAIGKDVAILGRAIDVHVSTLRKKLGLAGDMIRTIRGFGYKLEEIAPGAKVKHSV